MAEQSEKLGLYEVTYGHAVTTMKLTPSHAQEMANDGQGVKGPDGKEIKPEGGSFALGGDQAERAEAEKPPAKARASAANKARSATDAASK